MVFPLNTTTEVLRTVTDLFDQSSKRVLSFVKHLEILVWKYTLIFVHDGDDGSDDNKEERQEAEG